MHLTLLVLNSITFYLTATTLQTNNMLHLPIPTTLSHNAQDMQPLSLQYSHQHDLPVTAPPMPEIPIDKVLSAPLNTINRRNRNNSLTKWTKVNRQKQQTKHCRSSTDRLLRQNAHFTQPPTTAVYIAHQVTAQHA